MDASTIDQLVAALRPAIDVAGLEMLVGKEHRVEHGKPPRIVWVPIGGQIQPLQFGGGPRQHKVGDKVLHFYPIYDDVVTIEAHLWADSYAAFERLHQRLLSATKELFKTASTPGSYVVDTETTRAGHVHAGETKAMQMFAWRTTVAATRKQPQPGLLREAGPKLPTQATVTILGTATAMTLGETLDTTIVVPAS